MLYNIIYIDLQIFHSIQKLCILGKGKIVHVRCYSCIHVKANEEEEKNDGMDGALYIRNFVDACRTFLVENCDIF